MMRNDWEDYDPSWLVHEAQLRLPDELSLHRALSKCTRAITTLAYIYFVSPENPNQPGAEWQFDRNVILEATCEGDLVLDVLKDGRVGGVEFLDRIPG